MTSESNSTAQSLGFTNCGRPVPVPSTMRLVVRSITGEPTLTTIAPPDTEPAEIVDDTLLLTGESGIISRNLKSFAFAKSRALHWSRALGEVVCICAPRLDGGLDIAESVDASAMSDDEYAAAWLAAEVARLEDAVASLGEIAMDVRAAREDANEALDALRAASKVAGAPIAALAEAARGFAESFETRAWYVLIDEADDDMLAETSAS